ncbi:hypothetical protein Psi02_68720 [Planotetraspora silvatica]|uniref:Uncharacterized protein n=1 Tax=Planotetraspora silvatica TaxID=234614 RepID=A0A8J3XVC6_9ACTN|nr:hypothetical protein [Planotetraspora silvatica]GII50448.1 hypothetical protein Psi02_68720 [Planotetraspora silvatica]
MGALDMDHSEEDSADLDEVEQFSDEARKRMREAAEAFTARVMQHTEALCGMKGQQREIPEIFALNGPLSEAARRFADAQFNLTGTSPSLEDLDDDDDEDDDDEDEDEDEDEDDSTERIAVLMRHDFLITNREALMAAGRAAYLKAWPADAEDDAAADVQAADRAIYQLMHASGGDRILDDVPGLMPDSSVQVTLYVEEPLDVDDPFAVYYDED